jgi:hypothetical protein
MVSYIRPGTQEIENTETEEASGIVHLSDGQLVRLSIIIIGKLVS